MGWLLLRIDSARRHVPRWSRFFFVIPPLESFSVNSFIAVLVFFAGTFSSVSFFVAVGVLVLRVLLSRLVWLFSCFLWGDLFVFCRILWGLFFLFQILFAFIIIRFDHWVKFTVLLSENFVNSFLKWVGFFNLRWWSHRLHQISYKRQRFENIDLSSIKAIEFAPRLIKIILHELI